MKKFNFSPPAAGAAFSAFFLFFLNFNALYNYGSGYDTSILITNFIFFLICLPICFISIKSQFSLIEITLSLALFFFITIVFCKNIFDGVYGMLDVATILANGKISCDILYHSTIAESIVNYYIPSILIDGMPIRNYHFFSHIIIAVLSTITDIPPFFVYNYLYPQIGITLFIFLYFKLIQSIGEYFSCSQFISILAGCVLLLLQILLIVPGSYIISQSYFISIIFCLLYLNIFYKFYLFSESKNFNICQAYTITTLVFIFVISLTKISTGFIFLIGCSCYIIRQSIYIHKRFIILFLFAAVFLSALMLCKDASVGLSEIKIHSIQYAIDSMIIPNVNLLYIVFFVIIIRVRKFCSNHSLKTFISQKSTILEECLIITLVCCCILSFFIGNFSDFYYFLAALSFFGLLACFLTMAEFFLPNIKFSLKNLSSVDIILCCMLFYIISNTFLQDFKTFGNTFLNLKYQRSIQAGTEDVPGILSFNKYFSKSSFFESRLYAMLKTIGKTSDSNREQYGIYTSDIKSIKFIHPLSYVFYYQALTGIVRYAPLYRTEGGIFTNTNQLISKNKNYPYFGLNKIIIPTAATLEEAKRIAKADGKKFLFHIFNDNLYIIDLEDQSSSAIKF